MLILEIWAKTNEIQKTLSSFLSEDFWNAGYYLHLFLRAIQSHPLNTLQLQPDAPFEIIYLLVARPYLTATL